MKLGDIVDFSPGRHISPSDLKPCGQIPYVASSTDLSVRGFVGRYFADYSRPPFFGPGATLLMYRMGNMIGRTYRLLSPVYAADWWLFLKVKDTSQVCTDYLCLYLNSIAPCVSELTSGSTIPRLGLERAKGIVVDLPPMAEQFAFATNAARSMGITLNQTVNYTPSSLQGRIKFSGNYEGTASCYDPFRDWGGFCSGLLYFRGKGPGIRLTRYRAFSGLDDTTFRNPAGLSPIGSIEKSDVYTCVGRVDFKAGQLYNLPSPDPNASFGGILEPQIEYEASIDKDGNTFIKFEKDFKGDIGYRFSAAEPVEELAFSDYSGNRTPLSGMPNLYGIKELKGSYSTLEELLLAIQKYFSLYDNSCRLGFDDLEGIKGRLGRIAFMVKRQAGSCRHRAFLAFLIISSVHEKVRYVVSRTHAWLEIFLNDKWVYLDLGGCPVSEDPEPRDAGTQDLPNRIPYQGYTEPDEGMISCYACPDFAGCQGRSRARCRIANPKARVDD